VGDLGSASGRYFRISDRGQSTFSNTPSSGTIRPLSHRQSPAIGDGGGSSTGTALAAMAAWQGGESAAELLWAACSAWDIATTPCHCRTSGPASTVYQMTSSPSKRSLGHEMAGGSGHGCAPHRTRAPGTDPRLRDSTARRGSEVGPHIAAARAILRGDVGDVCASHVAIRPCSAGATYF
jgi:hypothetical protein